MLPLVLLECPEFVRPAEAAQMAELCNRAYECVTGKKNKNRKHGYPIVCASTAGMSGFWSLECNDPELGRDVLDKIVQTIRELHSNAKQKAK